MESGTDDLWISAIHTPRITAAELSDRLLRHDLLKCSLFIHRKILIGVFFGTGMCRHEGTAGVPWEVSPLGGE